MKLVVISHPHPPGTLRRPFENYALLIVDADAVATLQLAGENLELVARR
jgi:hypothetical protein